MNCNHCGNQAEWVENKEVYGRNYGKSYMIYLCRPCDAYVGCHNNTTVAKGTFLAKQELRQARKRAHAVIDPLWQSKKYRRGTVYARLGDAFGREIHIAETRSVAECEEIIRTTQLIFNKPTE